MQIHQDFCSNICGAKQVFCSNILGAKQDICSNILNLDTMENIFLIINRNYSCHAWIGTGTRTACDWCLDSDPCIACHTKPAWTVGEHLCKHFERQDFCSNMIFECDERCLFKHFKCKARLFFQTFWAQTKTFVQTFWMQGLVLSLIK